MQPNCWKLCEHFGVNLVSQGNDKVQFVRYIAEIGEKG